MTERIKINDNTWAFEEPEVRFFLLTGNDMALLIDSGMEEPNARKLAEECTDLPIALLNTHADVDHIGCNAQFDRCLMHPADFAQYHKAQGGTTETYAVWDGDIIDLGDRTLKIIEIPGHTAGSIAVLDIEGRMLFSGDPIQDGEIYMYGPYRDMHAYVHSLRRLDDSKDAFDLIYPSHGTCPVEPAMISQLADAAGRVISGEIPGTPGSCWGAPILRHHTDIADFLCDAKE